jgi:hypothetical protein
MRQEEKKDNKECVKVQMMNVDYWGMLGAWIEHGNWGI